MAKEKKSSTPSAQSKADLVTQLEDVAQFMEIAGENEFKIRAFKKGADAVRSTAASLDEIASGAVKIAGVGEGLKGAIKEFLSDGEVKARAELAGKIPPGVFELMKIPGLGAKKATLIQSELGINTIGELEYACRENRLTSLKGFGAAIQQKILRSIEERQSNSGKRRIDEALERVTEIEQSLRKHLGREAKIHRVGAMGRKAEIVETLELCFAGELEKIARAIESLAWSDGLERRSEKPFATELSAYSGVLKDGSALILWVCENDPDPETLLWLCAEDDLRDEMVGRPEAFKGYEPSWMETEWFDTGRRPLPNTYRLSRDGQVKGIFHCHTNFSDGDASLEDMVRAAEKRGYEYIGISDHSQTAHYAQGLIPERILEQRQMIKALQKKVSIKIFHGVESDILQDGALDYDEEFLNGFDFIVGSIHSRFKMDEQTMTARIVSALKNPHITMWGHPTGRLILARKAYELDWSACLAAAAESGVAIEINANPHRLDIDWRMGGELERRKLKVCINPDAHSIDGLDDTRFGEFMAEKAMLSRESILNLLSVDEMEKYLWERKKYAAK